MRDSSKERSRGQVGQHATDVAQIAPRVQAVEEREGNEGEDVACGDGMVIATEEKPYLNSNSTASAMAIDGGPAGFKPRTVTLTDLACVVVAARDIEANGGVLDEARVNRLRYLEGTARGSTRWIDTGWAIAAFKAASIR